MTLPQQHEVDFSDPSQRFLWAFRGIEINGFPMAIPEPVLKEWSKHLSKCGFVHESEILPPEDLPSRQTIHYQPPVRGQNHDFNMSGKWIPIDQPLVSPTVPSVSLMTPQEKAQLIRELKEEGLLD